MLYTRQPQTENSRAEMARRNAARVEIVKRVMGTKYACHPVNHVQRKRHRNVLVTLSDAAMNGLLVDVGVSMLVREHEAHRSVARKLDRVKAGGFASRVVPLRPF